MTNWTETLLAECKRLYIDEGKSAAETARALGHGITRNSVVGQAHRRGWTKHHRKAPTAPTVKLAPKVQPFAKPAISLAGTRAPVAKKEIARLRERQQAEAGKASARADKSANDNSVPLVGRRFGQCAWPVGAPARPADQLCCAKTVPEGARRPYCREHLALAIGKVVSAKELQRSLRRYA